ncbi:MAG: ABC transporter permease [Actinomycetales bacterium]|nr:ABC transporter permease [Actinomycetales bacterium]
MNLGTKSGISLAGVTHLRHLLPAFIVLIAAVVWGATTSPYFLNGSALLYNTGRYMEVAVLALAMTVIIIHGDIDLSIASNVAFSAAVLGLTHQAGVPVSLASLLALLTGAALGAVNGFFVTVLGLPSLVVTLGTLALYRGMTQIALGDGAVTGYPGDFMAASQFLVVGVFPLPLILFFALAFAFWLLMAKSTFGIRAVLAGSSLRAAMFSGVRVNRSRFTAFVLGGTMAGVAAILITARLGSTRSNVALGLELLVITVVVLGGTDIFGGKGTIGGTVVALFAVMAVREALAINNVNGQIQDAAIGMILILTISLPHLAGRLSSGLERRRFSFVSSRNSLAKMPANIKKGNHSE